MARRKVTCALQLENWQQADDALRQIGENRRDLASVENMMNERIADAKADAEAKGRPIKDHIAMLEQALREFATLHRADLGKAKSRTLTFGKVGFRQSTRLTLPRGAEKVKTIIEELLRRGMKECVVYPEPKIDKDALKKYSAGEIAEVGATWMKKRWGSNKEAAGMALKVTSAQLKAIFALSRKLGMDMEDLHGMAYRISGTDSLRTLSGREAGRMIEELKTRCGQPVIRTGGGAGRATEAQQRKIFRLTCELGWNDQPERLRGYIRRMCKADDVRFLTPQQASVVIDGLTAMRDGDRAERKA